jgi:hypothetical protein
MTQQEYQERNVLGYEGDTFIHNELKKLVDSYKIDLIIETGTYFGYTTKKLAELAPVKTIEINKEYFEASSKMLKSIPLIDVESYNGDSPTVLNQILNENEYNNVLFFLDAHWGDVCPLLDELHIIRQNQPNNIVIVIHDFLVPNRPDLGFDKYKGQAFTFEWIKPHIDGIYGLDQYSFHYNTEADGAKRGIIYIYPNKKKRKQRTKKV